MIKRHDKLHSSSCIRKGSKMDDAGHERVRPLDGITVLDFSHALAGPVCTGLLSDFGARVIKVEKPGQGDICRYMSMKEETMTDPIQGSASYLGFNKNKESIALDLAKPEGRQLARRLASRCDVVVQNFRPGVMERLGLSYEELKRENPSVIYCDISAFGDGPLAQEPGMDLVIQARAGTIAMTGEPGGPPVRPGVSLSDMSGGLLSAIGILLAIRARDFSGRGQEVNVSLFDATLFMMSQHAGPILNSNLNIEPMGSGHPQLTPYQAYSTADGWIFIGAGTNDLWQRLCVGLGLPEIQDDERFRTNAARLQHRKELETIISRVLRTKSAEEWDRILRAAGVPVSPIVTPRAAFLQALDQKSPMAETVEHPHYGPVHLPGRAILLSKTPGETRRHAPRLGEDTRRILRDLLSLDDDSVARLERDEVVAQYREEVAPTSSDLLPA